MGDTENTGRASEPAVRKAGRMLMFVAAAVLALGLGGWALLRSWSPGVPMPVLGVDGRPVPGSISEKIFACLTCPAMATSVTPSLWHRSISFPS